MYVELRLRCKELPYDKSDLCSIVDNSYHKFQNIYAMRVYNCREDNFYAVGDNSQNSGIAF